MTECSELMRASYRSCREICRRAGSNFTLSFLLLPPAKRRAMEALYAFMRHTDDLADRAEPAVVRAEALSRWRAALEAALRNHPCPVRHDDSWPPEAEALLPALADTVARFQIPVEHLRSVIDGVEMDLWPRRYETFAELETYCRRVASAVGLACVHIWGFRGEAALEPAARCGIALQLTNILRDLGEDAQNDRVYLPLCDLRMCDYSVEELRSGVADERFDRLMELEIVRAEDFYRQGAELLGWLEPCGRRIFGLIMSTYRELLSSIKRRPREVLSRRVQVAWVKKVQIAARWTLLPPRVAALL
jgi:phytoene synthase